MELVQPVRPAQVIPTPPRQMVKQFLTHKAMDFARSQGCQNPRKERRAAARDLAKKTMIDMRNGVTV